MNKNDYPPYWKQLSDFIKDKAGWKCQSCGRNHDPSCGYTLTVHHIDGKIKNNKIENLIALCQRCHLRVQNERFHIQPNQGRLDFMEVWDAR